MKQLIKAPVLDKCVNYFVPDCRFDVLCSCLCRHSRFKAFRRGLNHYLKRFEYSAASTGNVICVTYLRPEYHRN